APLTAMAVMLVAMIVHALLFAGGGMVTCLYTVPLLLLFSYAAGAKLALHEARIGLALSLAFALAICLTDGPTGATPDTIVILAPLTAGIWGLGRAVRSRTEMAAELETRTEELR